MPSRTNPRSPGSRSSSRRLAFEVRPCRRAALAWAIFGLLTGGALCCSFTPHPAWRLIAAAAALAIAALPGLAVIFAKGPLAVRRFEWTAEGEWQLERPDGGRESGRLAGATATLGPWILLAWSVGTRPWHPLSRRYALIGVSQVSPAAFRALKGRLSLRAGRESGASATVRRPVAY
jgi:hypothetical protein